MQELSDLCRPVLKRVCEYWLFRRAGVEPSAEEALDAVSADLVSIRRKAEEDPRLAKLYRQVEEPLIFFIDYTIKEGGFRFSGSWRELARDYNELSGDEKFFDLLDEAKKAPDSAERIAFFFLLLGLGFDGMHRADKRLSVEALQSCAAVAPPSRSINSERLSPEPEPLAGSSTERKLWQRPVFALGASLVLAAAAFAWNNFSLRQATQPLRDALERTSYAAAPHLFAYQPEAVLPPDAGSEVQAQRADAVLSARVVPAVENPEQRAAKSAQTNSESPAARAAEQNAPLKEKSEKASAGGKTAKKAVNDKTDKTDNKAGKKDNEGATHKAAAKMSEKVSPAPAEKKRPAPAQAEKAPVASRAPADAGGWTSLKSDASANGGRHE